MDCVAELRIPKVTSQEHTQRKWKMLKTFIYINTVVEGLVGWVLVMNWTDMSDLSF